VDNENEGGGEVETTSTEEGESEERENEERNKEWEKLAPVDKSSDENKKKNENKQFWKNLYEQSKPLLGQWLSDIGTQHRESNHNNKDKKMDRPSIWDW
jgi:hypothetical protein